jgi:hypothetical protein
MKDADARPRLYAYFASTDMQGRLLLTLAGTKVDIERLGVKLQEGMKIIVDDHDELDADAIVRCCPDFGWVAEIDWDAIRRRS